MNKIIPDSTLPIKSANKTHSPGNITYLFCIYLELQCLIHTLKVLYPILFNFENIIYILESVKFDFYILSIDNLENICIIYK